MSPVPSTPSPLPDGERVRVFLVEDQPPLLKALDKALRCFPELEVVGSAQEGEEAVAAVVRQTPQLVLLDLELPSLHGIEVCRRIKRRLPSVEVLVLTSFDDEQKVYDAMQAGASGYLVKRVGPDRIRAAIHEVMAGGTVVEAQIARRFWNYFDSLRRPADPAAGPPQDPWGLIEAEREVLRFVAKGLSNAEVGRVMTLERRTVRTHLTNLYKKMGVSSHVEAVVLAFKAGLLEL